MHEARSVKSLSMQKLRFFKGLVYSLVFSVAVWSGIIWTVAQAFAPDDVAQDTVEAVEVDADLYVTCP